MKDVKAIVAQNLAALRKNKGLTQAELAEQFNYSDKAVCRWERGDTLPDVNVLYALCEFYGVTMNDLVADDFSVDSLEPQRVSDTGYRIWSCILTCSAVWLLATVIFAAFMTIFQRGIWIVFVWAVPVTCMLIAKTLKGMINWVGHIIVFSLFAWSMIAALYLHIYVTFGVHIWPLFLVGVPLQAFIVLWQRVKHYRATF